MARPINFAALDLNALPRPGRRAIEAAVALMVCSLVGAVWLMAPHVPLPALALLIAALPVAVWLLFQAPLVLVVGFICFSLFRVHEVILPLKPLRIPQLLALGALAALALMFFTRRLRAYLTIELGLLLSFFILVTLQIPFAANSSLASKYWSDTYSKIMIMAFAVAWLVEKPSQISQILRVMTIIGAGIAGVAVYNSLNGIGLVEGSRVTINRAQGSALGDPNDLAMVLLFPIGFAASLAIARSSGVFDRFVGIASMPVLVWGLLATQSRGGLLGLVAVMGVFAWNRVRNKLLLIAVGVLALIGLFAAAGIGERSVVAAGGGVGAIDESAEGRLLAWGAATSMALANPLTGVGIDNFVPNFYYYVSEWHGMAKAVHSTWFQALGETGFTGFFLFIALIAVTAMRGVATWRHLGGLRDNRAAERLRDQTEALLAALAGFCVAGTFLTQAFTWPVYILIALLVSAKRIEQDLLATPSAVLSAPVSKS
ncbi:MAG: O-antigen ligase family protein [Geminicoccaceae bacterium]